MLLFSCESEVVAQWCPTLCDPMDCSLLGSYVRRIFEARMLEWVAISFSSRVQLFTTPWTAACQTPLTVSWSLLKLVSIESVMPSNHLILCYPLLTLALRTPILWPPNAKSWLIWKDPDAGTDWRQEEKGTTGWDGWMASPTQWTWVWVNSRCWRSTGRPGMPQSMGSQSPALLSDWTELSFKFTYIKT